MLNPQRPRLYKIKNARTDITHEIELVPLPGRNGVYRPIKNCLALVLSRKLGTCKELLSSVQVKFSGDGARFTSASYVLLSFSFPSLSTDVLVGSGNHTFAAIRCVEKYRTLEAGLESVFTDIDELIQLQEIEVNEIKIKLEIILGVDMKFILILLGLNAAFANYSCIWCYIHKKERLATYVNINMFY